MSIRVYLNPGEVYVGRPDERIETVLGSCVAITLWDARRQIGGMCHFLLPRHGMPHRKPVALDGRYGDEAMALLCEQMTARGVALDGCEVKLFGGARVFEREQAEGVGQVNADFARALIADAGLMAINQDLGGRGYRYLRFQLDTGDVWVRYGASMPQALPA